MKQQQTVSTENTAKLESVNVNDHGAYFIYKVKVQRGIKGKTKSKVDELLIVGVPFSGLDSYCRKEGVVIVNEQTGETYGKN